MPTPESLKPKIEPVLAIGVLRPALTRELRQAENTLKLRMNPVTHTILRDVLEGFEPVTETMVSDD